MGRETANNESSLVAAARQGDSKALRTLLVRNWTWLKALVYSVVRDPDDTDDVMQNVCVRVITRIGTLREPERLRPWLAAIARNEALNLRRSRRRAVDRPSEVNPDSLEAPALGPGLDAREDAERILAVIRELPDKYRQVLVLQLTGQMSYSDIAETLEIPVTTVQVRLVRARRMVQDRLCGINTNKVPRT